MPTGRGSDHASHHTLDAVQLIQRLERRIHRLSETVESRRAQAASATDEANRAEAQLARPWEHADELTRLRRRQQDLDEALNADSPADAPAGAPAPDLVNHALHDVLSIARFDGSTDSVTRLRDRLEIPRSSPPDTGLSL